MINFCAAEFIKSAVSQNDFPSDVRPQIVFAGRSNVGKSSLINKLVNRKNFARVGSTPGKTAHINFFLIDKKLWFVDLPGYGYAKVSHHEKQRWAQLLEQYFDYGSISFGVLIVDIRHVPTPDDKIMCEWFFNSGVPFIIIANKSDKLSKAKIIPALQVIRETLDIPDSIKVLDFSAEKGSGVNQLINEIIEFNSK